MTKDSIEFEGIIGRCGDREVFLGYGAAATLSLISFPDVLDEASGAGYQRRFSSDHSLEFKRYIQTPGATSIPLTFNLRTKDQAHWQLVKAGDGRFARLLVSSSEGPVMAQVDGQHRLGFLQESPIEFAFMVFLGLSVAEEMEVFRTINGKAKGLSGSLLDFTEAKSLGSNLPLIKPALYVAMRLRADPGSPWYQRLDIGGNCVVGTKRIASFRTMQVAVKRFIRNANWSVSPSGDDIAQIAIDFWRAVAFVLRVQWENPRKHLLVKGIGVYALMSIAGILTREASENHRKPDFKFFVSKLSDFVDQFDWSTDGPLQGFGGTAGADAATELLLGIRNGTLRRLRAHG